MKHILLLIIFSAFSLSLIAQGDPQDNGNAIKQDQSFRDLPENTVLLYPVPVQYNSFNIKSTKEISFIKVTNIIGQDIFRVKYNTPQLYVKINLENPRRGMYLVVIMFSDNTRIVKKIMIEGTD